MTADSPADSPEAPAPRGRKAAFAFVFITVFLDLLAMGLIVPVLPNLVNEMTGGDLSAAALMVGAFSFAWAAMQFLFMPILGGLSDQIGRRPILLISNFGQAISLVLTAVSPGFGVLLVSRMLSGAVSAVSSTANAYIADVEPPERRAAKFGMLGAAFGFGFIIGPVAGGWLGGIDIKLPFWVAAALCLINGLYGVFVLPESLRREDRSPFRWAKANPLAAFGFLASQPRIRTLIVVRACVDFAHVVYPATLVLYGLHRYGWGPDKAGLTLGLIGVGSLIVQAGLVGPIVKRFGEVRTLVAGLSFGALAYGSYALAGTELMFWLAIPLGSLSGVAAPALQGLLTRQVGPNEQGRLQGAVGSVQATTAMLGPVMFASLFAWAVADERATQVPGAPFALACAFVVLALCIAAANRAQLKADQAWAQNTPT